MYVNVLWIKYFFFVLMYCNFYSSFQTSIIFHIFALLHQMCQQELKAFRQINLLVVEYIKNTVCSIRGQCYSLIHTPTHTGVRQNPSKADIIQLKWRRHKTSPKHTSTTLINRKKEKHVLFSLDKTSLSLTHKNRW